MKFNLHQMKDGSFEVQFLGQHVGILEEFPESSVVILTGPLCDAPLEFKDSHCSAVQQALGHLAKEIAESLPADELIEYR
jgi:hypothetical protein